MTERPLVERLSPPDEPFAQNRISPGFRVGDLLILAGQVSVDADGNTVGVGDFEAQAEQVFANIRAILNAGGADLSDVIKTTIYLVEAADRTTIHRLRETYFTPPYPASTMLTVAALARPELLLEIDVIAVAGRPG